MAPTQATCAIQQRCAAELSALKESDPSLPCDIYAPATARRGPRRPSRQASRPSSRCANGHGSGRGPPSRCSSSLGRRLHSRRSMESAQISAQPQESAVPAPQPSSAEQPSKEHRKLRTMVTATSLVNDLKKLRSERSTSKDNSTKSSVQASHGTENVDSLEFDETAELAKYRHEQRLEMSHQDREKARRWRERMERQKQQEAIDVNHVDAATDEIHAVPSPIVDENTAQVDRVKSDAKKDRKLCRGRTAVFELSPEAELRESSAPPSYRIGNAIKQSQVLAALSGGGANSQGDPEHQDVATASGAAARWLLKVRPKTARDERVGKLKRMSKASERRQRLLNLRKAQFMKLPDDEKHVLRNAFTNFDHNGSSTLDPQELQDCLEEMGLKGVGPGQQREVSLICQEVAILGDIDFFSFCFELVPRVRESLAQMNRASLHETFETYDTDGNGSLSEAECAEIFKKLVGTNMDSVGAAQLEEAFQQALTVCRRPDEEEIQFDRFEQLFSRLAQSANRIRRERQEKIAHSEGLSAAEVEAHKNEVLVLYDSFCRADIDGSGRLSKHEVRGMILEHGLMPKDAAAYNRMIATADNLFGGKDLTFRDCLTLFGLVRADQERSSEAELSQLFKLYDRDLSGELNMVEISAVLSDYGLTPRCREDQEAIKRLLDEIDADGSGTFEFHEFLKLIQRIEERMQALQFQREAVVATSLGYTPAQILELRDCFYMLDVDGSGALGVEELREVLDAIRISMTSDQLKDLTTSLATAKSLQMNAPHLDFEGFMRFAHEIGYKP
eukprot:gnl/MRDRNA2_/MRDRNA2_115448_c0_seq1.p1 gnl/MRDRNA2_/MRDRNA2_115448_c0~~gnl/MRDRNA2_/MRDRNA2_115448_c0_seq1.p1  ORF type:complete len:828 (-),score=164.11 gnl/MRDRNA2_/MRDRNA2_115448_c0_seq1:46-2412(-)